MRFIHLLQPLPALQAWWRFGAQPEGVSGEVSLARVREMVRAGGEHAVVVFGGEDARTLARAHGLCGFVSIAPPLASPALAGPAARALLRRAGPCDAILSWGACFDALRPRVATLGAAWIAVDPATGMMRDLTTPGICPDAGSLEYWPAPPAPPAPHDDRARAARRSAARAAIGCTQVDTVVAILSDVSAPSDAPEALLLAGALQVSGRRVTLLLPRSCARMERGGRTALEGAYAARVIITERCTPGWLEAADVAAIVERGSGGARAVPAPFAWATQLRAAIDAGVPVVVSAEATGALGLDTSSRSIQGVAKSARSAHLASHAAALLDDPSAARACIDLWDLHARRNCGDEAAALAVVLESRSLLRAIPA